MAEPEDTFNALECCVCLEEIENSVILECSHTICLKCIQNLVATEKKNNRTAVSCPTCRSETPIPATGVAGFRRNRALEDAAAQVKKHALEKKTADEKLKMMKAQYEKLEEELKKHTDQAAQLLAVDAGDIAAALDREAASLRASNAEMLAALNSWTPKAARAPPEKKSQPDIFDGTTAPVTFKVVMIGNSSVGKTSLAHYFVHGSSCIDQAPTHGAKFEQLSWHLKSKPITLELWDTSGQDRQMSTLLPFVRGADAVLLVFDCTSLASIKDLERRFTLLLPGLRARHPPVVFLLANKMDRALTEHGDVWQEEGEEKGEPKASKEVLETALTKLVDGVHQQLRAAVTGAGGDADQGLVSFYTCSAKTGLNCKEIVEQLQLRIAFRQLYLSRSGAGRPESQARIVKLGSEEDTGDKSCCQ